MEFDNDIILWINDCLEKCNETKISIKAFYYFLQLFDTYVKHQNIDEERFTEISLLRQKLLKRILNNFNKDNGSHCTLLESTKCILIPKHQKLFFDFKQHKKWQEYQHDPTRFFWKEFWAEIASEENLNNNYLKNKLVQWFPKCCGFTEKNFLLHKKDSSIYCAYFLTVFILYLFVLSASFNIAFDVKKEIYEDILKRKPSLEFLFHYIAYKITNTVSLSSKDNKAQQNLIDFGNYVNGIEWSVKEQEYRSKSPKFKKELNKNILYIISLFESKENYSDIAETYIALGDTYDESYKPLNEKKEKQIKKICEVIFCNE